MKKEDCIFCKIAHKEIPGTYVYEDDLCVAFLDLSQVTKGHTLVVPKAHIKNILEADNEIAGHLFKVATQLSKQIVANLGATGCNILSNANEVAGQTVMHFHIHIIPRYSENDGFQTTFENNEGKFDLNEIHSLICS